MRAVVVTAVDFGRTRSAYRVLLAGGFEAWPLADVIAVFDVESEQQHPGVLAVVESAVAIFNMRLGRESMHFPREMMARLREARELYVPHLRPHDASGPALPLPNGPVMAKTVVRGPWRTYLVAESFDDLCYLSQAIGEDEKGGKR